MNCSNILTKEIAKQFFKDEDSVQLTEFTSIEVDAAGILSQHRGDLYFSALKTMSISVAEALTQCNIPVRAPSDSVE